MSLAEQFAPLRRKFTAREEEPEATTPEENSTGSPLEEAARGEREYVRERLREDLGREPTEEETSDWLRRHTEGY